MAELTLKHLPGDKVYRFDSTAINGPEVEIGTIVTSRVETDNIISYNAVFPKGGNVRFLDDNPRQEFFWNRSDCAKAIYDYLNKLQDELINVLHEDANGN